MRYVLALACLVLLGGCRQRQVAVEVHLPDASGDVRPARGVVVMALPYDRDSILTSLANEAPTPRPPTAELDSLFQVFRAPFVESTRLAARADRLRDSLRTLQAAGAGAEAVAAVEATLATVTAEAEAAARRLAEVREATAPRIEELRLEQRHWEEEAFRNYADITNSLTSNRLASGIADTTASDGVARLWLPPGTRAWWIHARSFNSGDPNAEWYWNVLMDAPRLVLDTTNAQRRPRY